MVNMLIITIATTSNGSRLISFIEITYFFFSDIDLNESTILPKRLLGIWKEVLTVVYEMRGLPKLLLALIDITIKENENSHRCILATLWIRELCRALLKSKKVLQLRQNYNSRLSAASRRRGVVSFIASRIRRRPFGLKRNDKNTLGLLFKCVEKDNPALRMPLKFSLKIIPDFHTVMSLVRHSLLEPTCWTVMFIRE